MLSSHRHRVVAKAGRPHSRPSSPKQATTAAAAASSSSPDLHADVVVAGAGAAGLTAAHFAARSGGSSVVVLERTSAAGRKILMSGGERANVLPVHCKGAPSDIRTESARSDRLANRMLRFWPLESTKHWLEHEIALPLQCERSTNKYFPASNSARELRDKLLASCLSLGVRFEYHSGVTSIRRSSGCWEALLEDGRTARSRSLVLATGGASVPKCGTDGVGYSIIEHDLGVDLVQPYRALVPLRGVHPGGARLPGVTLSAQTSAHDSRSRNSKKARSERTGFLFSHAGFSGPAVLDLSHLLVSGRSTHLSANFAGEPFDSVNEKLRTGGGRKLVKTLVAQWVPQRLSSALLAEQGIDAESTQAAQLTRKQRIALANALTAYDLGVTEPMGWSKAEVTAGGVRLTDVDVSTMELADAPNLHVIGELLETTGRIGGFNFYLSWVQGKLAGRSAARVSACS